VIREDRLAGRGVGGRTADLLVRPPKSVYRLIMEAPDLDHGSDAPPPPEDGGEGDRRPDPDWKLVGILSFMTSFCAVAAARYAVQLVKVFR
jgi:hypothetical protein